MNEGKLAIEFYKWMMVNNTEANAEQWFHYSDQDMFNAFKKQHRNMNNVIYKYEIDTIVVMPKGAEILSVQMQHDRPHLWAMVNDSNELEERQFNIVGTGWEMDFSDQKYIGTFQSKFLVWHVFEQINN